MRLGINVVRLTRPFTGVGRYVDCLLREWSHTALPFDEVVLFAPREIDDTRVGFPLHRFRLEVVPPSSAPDPFWEWRALRGRAREVDVLFCPSYTIPLGYDGRCVLSYFGPSRNRPVISREWWRSRAYDALYRYSARRADRVLTAASWVKQRVVKCYGVPEDRVEVIPLAPAPAFAPVRDPAALARVRSALLGGGRAPYVLFVGKLSARHSIPRLLEAFARVRALGTPPHTLVLVGPDVLGLDVPARARARGLEGAVLHVPHVPEADLPAVYSGAEALVFPASPAEGFGLPVLEAMACGTPVVSTALGSVPEVAGDAALLVSDDSVDALAAGLGRLLADAELRGELRRRGIERAAGFSWRTTAARTMQVLGTVASSPACRAVPSPAPR